MVEPENKIEKVAKLRQDIEILQKTAADQIKANQQLQEINKKMVEQSQQQIDMLLADNKKITTEVKEQAKRAEEQSKKADIIQKENKHLKGWIFNSIMFIKKWKYVITTVVGAAIATYVGYYFYGKNIASAIASKTVLENGQTEIVINAGHSISSISIISTVIVLGVALAILGYYYWQNKGYQKTTEKVKKEIGIKEEDQIE